RLARPAPMRTRILLADDHGLVRQGLRLVLEKEGFDVVGEAEDGLQAWRLSREPEPDVAILDLLMPHLNGIDAAREIQRCSPRTKTLLLTTRADDLLLEALAAGMAGWILKTLGARDLVEAIRYLEEGRVYLSPGLTEAVVQAYRKGSNRAVDPLSLREREVLQLIAEGRGTKQIADVLCISTRTVESHRYRIMRKLEIRETAGLVRYAISHGLSSVSPGHPPLPPEEVLALSRSALAPRALPVRPGWCRVRKSPDVPLQWSLIARHALRSLAFPESEASGWAGAPGRQSEGW